MGVLNGRWPLFRLPPADVDRIFSFFFWQPEDGKPIANAHQQKAIFGWVGELKANG
jgi:hypothetical protein